MGPQTCSWHLKRRQSYADAPSDGAAVPNLRFAAAEGRRGLLSFCSSRGVTSGALGLNAAPHTGMGLCLVFLQHPPHSPNHRSSKENTLDQLTCKNKFTHPLVGHEQVASGAADPFGSGKVAADLISKQLFAVYTVVCRLEFSKGFTDENFAVYFNNKKIS